MSAEFKIFNAAELWQIETSLPSIRTFSQNLDNVLGNGGIHLGALTELLGLPGSGKTQLSLQLCASVQVPKLLGGLESEALYIDTETNFNLCRFKEILYASLEKCQRILNTPLSVSEEDVLKKIHYVKAIGLEKFCAFMYQLQTFISDKPNIRLIVIDSITTPFKDGISLKQRTGLLFRLMADLQKLAVEKRIAVVLTNEMTTRLGLSSGSIVGALGDTWAHRCNTRLLLSEPNPFENVRFGLILKSNNASECVGKFKITQEGIRDV